MPREVTAFSNTTVKRLRSLRDKKVRRNEGLRVIELDHGAIVYDSAEGRR